MNGGSFLVYASSGNLYKVPSLGGAAPVVLSAGHQPGDQDSAPQGGANGVLVFQRVDGQSSVLWIWVYNGYTGTADLIANSGGGTSPLCRRTPGRSSSPSRTARSRSGHPAVDRQTPTVRT